MKKTALQQAIERVEKKLQDIKVEWGKAQGANAPKYLLNEFRDNYNGLQISLLILQSLLPTEKEQKKEDYEAGVQTAENSEFGGVYEEFEQYFTNTYEQ